MYVVDTKGVKIKRWQVSYTQHMQIAFVLCITHPIIININQIPTQTKPYSMKKCIVLDCDKFKVDSGVIECHNLAYMVIIVTQFSCVSVMQPVRFVFW